MRVVIESSIFHIQSDSGGQVIILGGDNIDHCMNMCLIPSGYRDRAV
jgi:hypothetical protein